MEEEEVEEEDQEVEKKEREERQEQMEAGWASPQPAAHTAAPHKCLENSCPLLHITIQCKRTMYTTVHTSYLSRAHERCSCKFFLAGVNFYRFNAKNWQFNVYFAVITQKIGSFLCILL